jgi:hypothetical protein
MFIYSVAEALCLWYEPYGSYLWNSKYPAKGGATWTLDHGSAHFLNQRKKTETKNERRMLATMQVTMGEWNSKFFFWT